MKIQQFIRDHFQKHLEKSSCLVIYDPERIYSEIVQAMAGKTCEFIDASQSTILGREKALEAWRDLAKQEPGKKHLIVYLPVAKPTTDEAKQRDPYQIFALGGVEFPSKDGDSYQSLCHTASPGHVKQIDELFAAGRPDFETINNLIDSATAQWPKLRTLLKVESPAELLVALMSPSEAQREALKVDKTWGSEFCHFVEATLGFQPKTKSHQWTVLSDELWRFVLFSEFAFDLPASLPEELKDVPRAEPQFRDLVYHVCVALRSTEPHQQPYLDRASNVAEELQLENRTKTLENLGERDTFAFEERTHLKTFGRLTVAGNLTEAKSIAEHRRNSIWVKQDPGRQTLWTLADRALELLTGLDDAELKLSQIESSATTLFDFYCGTMRHVDGRHREFEHAVSSTYGEHECLEQLVEATRQRYLRFAERLQRAFMEAVSHEGWPVSGKTRLTDVFDKFVAPLLEQRKKAALFLVDAMRYELAFELESGLAPEFQTKIHAVCAQLPTTTAVGMAALMPRAVGKLRLVRENDRLEPYLGERKVKVPQDRHDYIGSIYGDQVEMYSLDDLISKKKLKPKETTRLLLVKTTDIDDLGEANPTEARRALPGLMKKLIAGIHRVRKLKFEKAVVATDHGFILLHDQEPGDVVQKPAGEWIEVKDRCLLGTGSKGQGCVVFEKEQVGIEGDFENYVVPIALGTFIHGRPYFHEGLSLQECVLPVVCLELGKGVSEAAQVVALSLSYKGGSTNKITTRLPMIEVTLPQTSMFIEHGCQFQLEAYDAQGNLVGEASSCPHLNPATRLVQIKAGETIKVPLRMEEEFQGAFEVRAIDPRTQVNHSTLKLKTDYMD